MPRPTPDRMRLQGFRAPPAPLVGEAVSATCRNCGHERSDHHNTWELEFRKGILREEQSCTMCVISNSGGWCVTYAAEPKDPFQPHCPTCQCDRT